MRPGTYFDIEFELAGSGAVETGRRAGNEADVSKFARENLQPNSSLLVACLGDGVDYGNLILEVDAQGDVVVRALEHRGFVVKRVSLVQALGVLEYWLPSQERSPSVQWLEE
jgi:hypothetical protein